jgi:hypothetical protein
LRISRKISETLHQTSRLPPNLAKIVRTEFDDAPAAEPLFLEFLTRPAYSFQIARRRIDAARNSALAWNIRLATILMLEHQVLRLWKSAKFDRRSAGLLHALGLMADGGVDAQVLHEGYTSIDPPVFAGELCARLRRLDHVHRAIHGLKTQAADLLDFIRVSRKECKLTLARYLFDPGETAAHILEQIHPTSGLQKRPDPLELDRRRMEDLAPRTVAEFDRQLVNRLRAGPKVLWVCDRTSSELNSLVEYPLGTVALVVKPPGSDVEFEVKRAGIRGPHPLTALFERNGKPVPPFHRMQGASCGYMLDYETNASHRFAEIYRATHGVEPPMSRFLGITSISAVPRAGGEAHVLDYFTDSAAFGDGFREMRGHLRRATEAFEGNELRADLAGEFGWTVRFFTQTVPNQAWIAGTTSYRLDRTADLLGPRGPEIYFCEGLGRDFTAGDARWLASQVLEEVLGVFEKPHAAPENYDQYVPAALAWPPNRAAADAAYLDAVADIGLYWGTLLAMGGWTEGESFVSRNVGLKSRWIGGRWCVRICFMDHDCLLAVGAPGDVPHPARPIDGMRKDSDWICEDPRARGEFACLREIYRVSASTESLGRRKFEARVLAGYTVTRRAMAANEAVASKFEPGYLRILTLRDDAIRTFLATEDSEEAMERWKAQTIANMTGSLYSDDWISGFCGAVVRNRRVLTRYRFLYESR